MRYSDITGKIIACAMKVHRHFGPGFPEIVYKKAMILESKKAGLDTKWEVSRDIIYDGVRIYTRKLDLLIEDLVLVELKAVSEMDNSNINQVLNCLKVFEIEVGLLINFGSSSLKFKRFVL